MLKGMLAVAMAAVVVASAAPAALAAPQIQAHRGGSVINGVPTYPENTLPAFQNAAAHGWVLEMDTKLTADRVPVVIHDDTVDRTTACSGAVSSFTLAQLGACPSDVLGSPGGALGSAPAPTPVPIPTLRSVLEWARDAGARVSLEIKNLPTDNDFDPLVAYAKTVLDTVKAVGFPRDRIVIQSFWPTNLIAAQIALPGAQTAFLTQAGTSVLGAVAAGLLGYTWWSPSWPVARSDVQLAHLLGRRVVPYTIDTAAGIQAARAAGVDAVITDDPAMAQAALGG
jgi:glycerophosphoryl diester phosphodiesterase